MMKPESTQTPAAEGASTEKEPETVKELEHITLKFDHTKNNVYEAMGFASREKGSEFMNEVSKRFNRASEESNCQTELIEYFVSRPSDEQACLLFGILNMGRARRGGDLLSMLRDSLSSRDEISGCPCEDCTAEREAAKAATPAEPTVPSDE